MNYYIADTHIGHANIMRLDNRPFRDVEEMNAKMIERWNARVRPEDTVYVLGDFIWGREENWLNLAPAFAGNKILIRGNHDLRQFGAATRRLFGAIADYTEIRDGGMRVVLCHYPIPFFRADFSPSAYMLYGHVHDTIEHDYVRKLRFQIKEQMKERGTPRGNFINAGCMMPYMDYEPKTLEEIIEGDRRLYGWKE